MCLVSLRLVGFCMESFNEDSLFRINLGIWEVRHRGALLFVIRCGLIASLSLQRGPVCLRVGDEYPVLHTLHS